MTIRSRIIALQFLLRYDTALLDCKLALIGTFVEAQAFMLVLTLEATTGRESKLHFWKLFSDNALRA